VERVGLGYHPDTPFADYADRDGRATFSAPPNNGYRHLFDVKKVPVPFAACGFNDDNRNPNQRVF
jgi:hypothetical protein